MNHGTRTRMTRLHRYLSLLTLLAMLLGGCRMDTVKPTPTAVEPTATTAATHPPPATPPPTPLVLATATPTPAPTPTPVNLTDLPMPAPRLLYHSPLRGEEQALDAAVELSFNQAMDTTSTKAAFTILPQTTGTLNWVNEHTLHFQPENPWRRDTRYHVTLADSARNVEGTPLSEPLSFYFETVGFLSVSEVQPADGSKDLDPDTAVTVIFNRPVVPLTSVGRQSKLPNPLTWDPPVDGEGEWLNTSIYLFRPEEGFLPATTYEVRVTAGLTDTIGGILSEDFSWSFSTIGPAVRRVWPGKGQRHTAPTETVQIHFNQPMDHASVEERFSLTYGGQSVAGSFRWNGGETAIDPETMTFVPDQSLGRDLGFNATLSTGSRPQAGNLYMPTTKSWGFYTVKSPGLTDRAPRDGAHDVALYTDLSFTFASPMRREGFLDHLSITPVVTEVYAYWSNYDTRVRISFEKEPATSYNATLDATTPDKYGFPLGREVHVSFTTTDLAPYAVLNTGGNVGTYNAYTDTVVYASYRNVSRLDLGLYRLSTTTFLQLVEDWSSWRNFTPDSDTLIRQWFQPVEAPRNQLRLSRFDLTDEEGHPLPPGFYFLRMTAPGVRGHSHYMFVRSHINLTLKQSQHETLVWATDLATGLPVPGLTVGLYSSPQRVIASGITDADGLLTKALDRDRLWDDFFAISGDIGQADLAVSYNAWDDGIYPWSFGVNSDYWGETSRAYVYTDRPIYRPGQTVYFKGILRLDDDAYYTLPRESSALYVWIEDPQGKQLYRQELALSDMGTLYDDILLDEEAPLGTYYIYMGTSRDRYSSYARTTFLVAEYKKPEYEVKVTSERDAYLTGETIQVTVESNYYFGGPVANAEVHWSVLSGDYTFSYDCPAGLRCPRYRWNDREWRRWYYYDEDEPYGEYGHLVAEGDATTDELGRLLIQVPADITQEGESRRFVIEASVTDLNGQQVSNRTAVVVHQSAFYTGVAPQGYLSRVRQEKDFDIITVDWDGEPVADMPLTVVLLDHRWYSVRERDEYGSYYWSWETEDIPILTQTVTTDEDGRAVIDFSPTDSGSYRVRVIGRDEQGNEVRSSAYFWVWGSRRHTHWRRESNNRIELIADQEEYEVDDVAEILVPTPYSGTVRALVTIERGHIIDSFVQELHGNSDVLQIPIKEEYVPNVFISVIVVQGLDQAPDGLATFKMGLIHLPVSVSAKELVITLTPDRSMEQGEYYGPRQKATYDVLVTDQEGNPMVVELSLRLADLAVLALADERGPTLMARFWESRGLGVRTSMPLVVALEQYNRELEPGKKGGGGGGEGGGLIRTRFADTAFWAPAVRTGADGRAQVVLDLPDNLTTWRMQARAISADTYVGRAEVDVRSTLDLLVRSVLPRFFVVGDYAELATIVHNNMPVTMTAQVHFSATGLLLDGPKVQTATIAPQDKVKVVWPVTVQLGDEVRVRTWASAGDLFDGREDSLPVYHYATAEVMATAGHLAEPGVLQEIVRLPSVYDPTQGELVVQLDGSLVAASQDALDYLSHYSYECVEQTMSRFLPNVLTYQALVGLGLERPDLREKLEEQVGVGLQRLYVHQHYDGGWGWWASDASDPYITAYVLQGLLESHRAGFTVDVEVMSRGISFLRRHLPSVTRLDSHSEANRMAYQLYVLAEAGTVLGEEHTHGVLSLAIGLFEQRHQLDLYGQAMLAVALGILEPEELSRVQTLLSDLSGDAMVSASGTHWNESRDDRRNMNTNIRSTAIVLWAMSRLEPESARLPSIARWLMNARRDGHWETTQSTAWSLIGLVAYMQASGEMGGDFGYTVYLNDEVWGSGEVTPETIEESHVLRIEISQLLIEEGNRLVIHRHEPTPDQSGIGQLYYTAHLRYYLPANRVGALNRGIIVTRQYSLVDEPDVLVESARVGDLIKVTLTIIVPGNRHYVVVEAPLPAGCEGVDLGLETTSVVGERPQMRRMTAQEQRRWYRWYGWGWWWFSHTEMRDEKVALFARYLRQGTYQYTYMMRASVPGEFMVLPATAYEMYFPEIFGRSDGGSFVVTEE